MLTYSNKWQFIPVLSGLILLSTVSYGQGAPPPTPLTIIADANTPSVAQALVPEGILAMQLAVALNFTPIPDEAKAEELLSNAGIEPKSGWISEYPVTPAVLGDIEKAISLACEQKKIPYTNEQALKIADEVKAKLGFDVNSGSDALTGVIKSQGNIKIYIYTDTKGVRHFTDKYDSIPKEYQGIAKIISESTPHELPGEAGSGIADTLGVPPIVNPNNDVINNFYYEQGPPVVTYYSPPDPYYYLYSWVPYPFWSTGFYFTGFFILNNFHRHVSFNRQPYFVSHHVGSGATSSSRGVGKLDQTLPGQLVPTGIASSRWFATPSAQAGARAIIRLHQNQNRSTNGTAAFPINSARLPASPAGNPITLEKRSANAAPDTKARIFRQQVFNQPAHVPYTPRFNPSPIFIQNRESRMLHSSGRSVPGGYGGNHGGGSVGGSAKGGRR